MVYDTSDNFVFSAIRGIQAGREYYVVMCPLKLIPRIFLFNESEIPAKLRAQRVLNKHRIPEMATYITSNREKYVFSSITSSVDGNVHFIPYEKEGHLSKVGTLLIPIDSRFLINDGQHRRAAIEKALSIRPDLGSETISVVFYVDRGLKHSQQMFSDLNKYAIRPSTSLNLLYDHRDSFSQALLEIIEKVPIFSSGLSELEKTSISNRANKVFTLNSIYSATRELLGKTTKKCNMTEAEKELSVHFWNEIYSNMPDWKDIVNGNNSSALARDKYIHVYGITLHAFGMVGRELIKAYPNNWKNKLKSISKINWGRSNPDFKGEIIIGKRISKSHGSIIWLFDYIKYHIGILSNNKELSTKIKGGKNE